MPANTEKKRADQSTPTRKDLGKKPERAALESIGRSLGASHSFKVRTAPHGPFGVAALAREVQERLVSRGGRPSDAAPTIRRLVSIRKSVWDDLQHRADRLSAHGRSVSPAQLAAILLERGLDELKRAEDETHVG